jgi:hypothetical protein
MSNKKDAFAVALDAPQQQRFSGPYGAQRLESMLKGEPQTQSYPWDYHHDVFVIYRPWMACVRCKLNWENAQKAEAPDAPGDGEEDLVCPHTRKRAYLELWDAILHKGHRLVEKNEARLDNGVVQVSIAWVVRRAQTEPEKPATIRL